MYIENRIRFILNENLIKEYSKIPLRARLLIHPLTKNKSIEGKDWRDLWRNARVSLSSVKEFEDCVNALADLKVIDLEVSENKIKIAITKHGKDMVDAWINQPPRYVETKYSKKDAEEIQAYYASKARGGFTGD